MRLLLLSLLAPALFTAYTATSYTPTDEYAVRNGQHQYRQ